MLNKQSTPGAVLAITLFLCLPAAWSAMPSLGGPESASTSRNQVVLGTRGMVVSDSPEASQWGAEILRKGGNAIDAAVATSFMLSVTRPHYASLGGGGFLVYCPHPIQQKPQPCQTIDFREKAPLQASRDMFLRKGAANTDLSQNGALASGTPGLVAGLLIALEKFGTLPRSQLLARPIRLAKEGIRMSTHTEKAALARWAAMNSGAKQIFGCGKSKTPDAPCAPGTVIRQADLAKVLEAVSKSGTAGFYRGPVAQKIIKGIQEAGGILTLKDLESFEPKFRTPLRSEFEGHEVITMQPPSSGGALILQLLGYAERAKKAGAYEDGFHSARMLHAIIHGMSLAFADRAAYFGDPDFVKFPLAELLTPSYLDDRWNTFKDNHANLPKSEGKPVGEPQHTTHFSVIDREGNTVSMTETVNDNFGSGFVPPGTGIVMNNEMDDFSVQPGVPNLYGLVGNEANSIAAGKRPLSCMSPTIVRDSQGNVEIAIGAAGGPRIITSVFLSLINRLQFGMSLQDAVAASRFHQQWQPEGVKVEKFSTSPEVLHALRKMGYTVEEVPSLGKVHALERFSNGRTSGAADPRGEGESAAE